MRRATPNPAASVPGLALGILSTAAWLMGTVSHGADDRAAARRLWDAAHQNSLDDQAAGEAAGLLRREDPFVRGLAEWALAMKVGYENNGQATVWPTESPPAWFQRWRALPADSLVEMDWVRQAVSAGLDRDDSKLLASIDTLLRRGRRMTAEYLKGTVSRGRTDLIQSALAELESVRGRLAESSGDASTVAAERARLWLSARCALRKIALANPAVNFNQILLVTHHAAHTPRNITRTFSWQHKPGGDLVIVGSSRSGCTGPRLARRPARPRTRAQLRSVVECRSPGLLVRPPAALAARQQTRLRPRVEGVAAHELRKTHPPLQLFEINLDGNGLRQRTDDPYWNDFEPAYCADGSIVFASDRCVRAAECGPFEYDIANANLYRLASQGGSPQRLDRQQRPGPASVHAQ